MYMVTGIINWMKIIKLRHLSGTENATCIMLFKQR